MARKRDLDRPEALWKEKDMADGREVDAMVLILRTSGCAWSRSGGCTMCGYNKASDSDVAAENLLAQLEAALERYDGEPFVKIYTSGSFLDEREVPAKVREEVLQGFSAARRLLVESRPGFVDADSLSSMPKGSTVAIGLESSDDEVLRRSVRKGFCTEDYLRAAEAIKEGGLGLRSYLLLKPPYLSERAALEDAKSSVAFASRHGDEVSLNPVNVQRGTVVDRLWRRGDYRPPWLWSLLEVLRSAPEGGARLISSPSGGGTPRGVHNCGSCDAKILESVRDFSFSQDRSLLEGHGCGCRDGWQRYLRDEASLLTSVDVDRHLEDRAAISWRR